MRRSTAPLLGLLALVLAGCTSTPGGQAPAQATAGSAFNVLGRDDAPVSIIEFSDLQCPYCARFALQTFPEIRRHYVDTGKVRYAAKDFPLPFHPFAVAAAVAVRCAGEQGRFWEYRHALFAAQDRLGSSPYDSIAAELKLDAPRFAACRADRQQEAAVRADVAMAKANGVASTPTFVIGRLVDGEFQGETFSGAESYAQFAARIDAKLAEGK
jgi:protein-disulfide isomerase